MNTIKNIISLVLLLLVLSTGLIIGADNNTAQSLTLLDWTTPQIPLYQWLFIFLAIGFFIGVLFMLKATVVLQLKNGSLNRKLKKAENISKDKLVISTGTSNLESNK